MPAFHLVDTNVLARLTETKHPQHPVAVNAVRTLIARGDSLFIAPQNCVELWNLMTRPALQNGFGFTPTQAASELVKVEAAFLLLPETPAIFGQWKALATTYQVQGKNVHDTRLAAIALVYQIENILTFNFRDFQRFAPAGLTAVDPAKVTP